MEAGVLLSRIEIVQVQYIQIDTEVILITIMPPIQCSGITIKGERCRIRVPNGNFCHYHVRQSTSAPTPKVTSSPRKYQLPQIPDKPGYIYVYTMSSLLKRNRGRSLFKTRSLKGQGDKWVDYDPQTLKVILVKVGMTTQTVAKRILQWEAQCNHKLVTLYPNTTSHPKLSLAERLKRLSLHSRVASSYPTFIDEEMGFFVPKELAKAEGEIHQLLELRYGRRPIYCSGCVKKEEAKSNILDIFKRKEFLASNYNVHREWFPIPKYDIAEVYKIIDTVCVRYAT